MWYQPFIEAYKSSIRAARNVYRVASFLSLIAIIALIATHRVTGYAQADLSFGSAGVAAQTFENASKVASNTKVRIPPPPVPEEKPAAPK